ncbi:hypothetical protein DL96DRAFT_1576883 [Flagelloscypha sp. PMI_526]|nr:hypothetical protein DL96DRAFT_1576883 [Flagelloscypha sp. PMI_526]
MVLLLLLDYNVFCHFNFAVHLYLLPFINKFKRIVLGHLIFLWNYLVQVVVVSPFNRLEKMLEVARNTHTSHRTRCLPQPVFPILHQAVQTAHLRTPDVERPLNEKQSLEPWSFGIDVAVNLDILAEQGDTSAEDNIEGMKMALHRVPAFSIVTVRIQFPDKFCSLLQKICFESIESVSPSLPNRECLTIKVSFEI